MGILRALEGVEVHVPFPVSAAWAVRTQGQEAALRTSATIRPASRVGVLGANLASAYHTLRNEFGDQHWAETMEWVRLGLGRRVETVATLADPGGGAVALAVRYRPGIQVPAFGLSDGTLSYLALVATLRLVDGRSLLAVDEPDLHLHPNLVLRVAGLLETAARSGPVVVTTQSDHLLDGLQSPAASVRVLQLGREGATRCLSLDDEALAEWLTDYRGLGEIRAAGHLSSVLCDLDD